MEAGVPASRDKDFDLALPTYPPYFTSDHRRGNLDGCVAGEVVPYTAPLSPPPQQEGGSAGDIP